MEQPSVFFMLAVAFSAALARASEQKAVVATDDRTITRVVKVLQGMLDQSKADGDSERTMYAKYKCYCDQNEASKKESIASLTQQIGLLESEIDGLQADTGVLSSRAAELQANMAANVQARTDAQGVRDNENAAFLALETDYTAAISQMTQAIDVLAGIGADQTMAQAAADHDRFMSGYNATSLASIHKSVKQALLAASTFISKKQARQVESFLQAPFTGTYTAQSGEVVGILKDMRDTFETNLAAARDTEQKAAAAHTAYMQTMVDAHTAMSTEYDEKQSSMGDNDGELADKRTQLASAETQKSDDETFLAQLMDMCAAKAKDYEERTLLRKNEEAAIAEAISILNSDAAFATFGSVSATSTGATSLVQRSTIKRHAPRKAAAVNSEVQRQKAEHFLQKAAAGHESRLLSKVMTLLQAGNPFTIVLEEIQKMLALIAEEEQADNDQLSWCNTERSTNNANLATKNSEITALNTAIATLKDTIDNPTTGLKFQISETEAALEANAQSQAQETKDRKEASELYKADVKNLVEAQGLLTNAISVMEKYYAKFLGTAAASMLQAKRQPTPPSTWENDSYQGQSQQGGDVITMLQFILEETKKEEEAAHQDEHDSQHAYEDSMATLKAQEATDQQSLASLQQSLADAELDLMQKETDLKDTTAAKEAIEAYLLKIKPGCDFITSQIGLRQTNRAAETAALNSATQLLTASPAYLTAVAAAHNETFGDCLGVCSNEDHVDCKACLAKVTVPAYCAGHAGTLGC